MSLIIDCQNISKTFKSQDSKDIQALSNISFQLHEGDRLGIIGLNGSGKSTLLKIIAQHMKPSSGKIEVFKKVTAVSSFDSLLHQDLSGLDNIKLQLNLLNDKSIDLDLAIQQIIEFSELENFINEPVKKYSSGMMLKLTFSFLVIIKPEILLLDEVFSVGDFVFRKKINEVMLNHFKQMSGVIMVSHQMNEIAKFCNKCIVLRNGKIEFQGDVEEVVSKFILTDTGIRNRTLENDFVKVTAVTLLNKEQIYLNTKIKILVEYVNKVDDFLHIVLNLRTAYGTALTDCIIYRENYKQEKHEIGEFITEIEIPGNVLNSGNYFLDLNFGNKVQTVLEVVSVLNFQVLPNEWEKNERWNISPEFPTRPILVWKNKKI